MKKGNPTTPRTAAGCLVDEAVTRGAALLQGGLEIGNLIADMVNARTVAFQVPGDRRPGLPGGQQLDVGIPEAQGNDPGAIDLFGRAGLHAEHGAIECERFVEVGDGDTDMGQTRIRRPGH